MTEEKNKRDSELGAILKHTKSSERNEKLQEFIRKYAGHPRGHLYLGLNYIHCQHIELLGVTVTVLGTAGSSPDSREKSRRRNLKKAQGHFLKFMALNPQEEDRGFYQYQVCNLLLGEYDRAIEAIQEYLKQHHEKSLKFRDGFFALLGIAHREMGNSSTALYYLNQIPDDSKIIKQKYQNLGLCQLADDNLRSALSCFKKSLDYKKSPHIPVLMRAVEAEILKNFQAAAGHYTTFIDNTRHKVAYYYSSLYAEKRKTRLDLSNKDGGANQPKGRKKNEPH